MEVYEAIRMGNYKRWEGGYEEPAMGVVVVEDKDNYSITRYMFHPYSGAKPIHCAKPAGGYTFHRSRGYS